MAYIIKYLRVLIHDNPSTSTIFTDNELQNFLDIDRQRINREPLTPEINNLNYYSRFKFIEDSVKVYDGIDSGSTEYTSSLATLSTTNLINGEFTFNSDPEIEVYLDGYYYDMNMAASYAMTSLSTDETRANSWSRGGVSFNHYSLPMLADLFKRQGLMKTMTVRRSY